jgi:hypothetical protein
MKKLISAILLIGLIIMLVFNPFESILPKFYFVVEILLAFAVGAGVLFWNKDQLIKRDK